MKEKRSFLMLQQRSAGKMEEHHLTKEDIKGIGVGVPAPVTAEGVVNGSANLGWKYKEAKNELEELTGMKATFGNDANVAALGEMWKGGGAGCKNLVMVTLGNRCRRWCDRWRKKS